MSVRFSLVAKSLYKANCAVVSSGRVLVACAASAWQAPTVSAATSTPMPTGDLLVAELIEDKDIPIGIGDRESPQPLFYERQRLYERRTAPAKFVEECIRVHAVDVRVRRGPFVPGVVWTGQYVGRDGLEHDADPIPAHSGPERTAVWTLEVELKAEALAVVGDRGLQVLHDEGRPDRREISVRLCFHYWKHFFAT